MALYRLPDGRQLDIPDTASKEELIEIQNNLAQLYPDTYSAYDSPEGRTFFGNLEEVAKGVPRGFASTMLSAGEGVSSLFSAGNDSAAVDLFKNLQKGLNESALGVDKGYEDAFSSKFGQGLGSFASFFVPGAAVGKVTGLGGKVLAGGAGAKEAAKQLAKLQTGAVLPLAVPVGISEQAQNIELARSLGEEVGFGQEIASELLGGVIGASEIYSVQRLLKGIAKAPGQYYKIPERIRSAIQTGSAEAAQEALAGIAQDAVALGIYSDEIPLGDSLFDDLTVGGAVGAVSDLVFRGALGRRSAGNAYLRKQAQDAQEQEDIRFEEYQERYEQAVADGSVVLPSQLETSEQQAEKNPYAKVIYGDLAGTDLTALSDAELDGVALEYQEAMKFYENKPKYKDVYENFVGSFNALKIERQSRRGPSPEDERELPILETHTIKFNPDGTYSVVGNDSGVTKGTFETDNEARNQALQLDKTVRQVWLSTVVDNAIKINGLDMSGTSYVIGQRVYDPLQNTFDAKVLANYDSRVSPARKEQYKEEKKLSKKEQAIIDRQEFYKLSNVMKDNMLRDLLGPQVDALTESELSALREQLDQLPNIYPTYKQRTRKGKDGKVRPVVGQFDPATPQDAARLEDVTSQLSLFYDKLKNRGIEKKNFYSLAEAKKILKPEDFNALLKEKSEIQFQISAILNEKIGVKRNKKGEVDVSPTALKEAFDKKNIDIDLNSDAFKYFAESITGTPLYNKMTNGQKQLLISRILTLPRYNSKRLLPDFSPRPYTAKQLDNFYKTNIGQKVTLKQIKEQIKNLETGKPLTQKEIQKLKQDLVDSGRAVISKNRLEITQDYDLQKARKADDPRSTPEELRERLRNTTELQDIEIEQIVANQASSDAEILSQQDLKMLPPPSNPQKYGKLLEEMRERLNALGLKDISLRFDNALRDSLRVRQDPETGRYYFQQIFGEGTYDRPMKTILVSLEKADPDLSKTIEELKDSIALTVDHEGVHALIDLNLLTDKEMKILKDTANRVFTEEQIAEMRSNYPNLPEPNFQEELVAELFAVYRSNPDIIRAPKAKNIIERILQLLTTFTNTISNGFATPTSVLNDIASGEIGARQRGQIRSLHKLDKEIAQNPNFLETINPIVGDAATDRNRKDLDELNSIEKAIEQNIQEYRRGVAEMKVGEESNYPPDRIAGERVMKKASSNIKKFNKRKKVLLKKIGGVQQDLFTDVLASDIPTDRAKSIDLQYNKEERDSSEPLTEIDMSPLIIAPKSVDLSGFTSILVRGKQRVRHMMFGTAIDRRKDPNGNYADEFYILNKSDKEKRPFDYQDDYVGKVLAFIDNNSSQERPRAVGIQNIELEESARGKNIGQKTIEMLASTNPDIVSGKRDLEIYDIQNEAKGFWEALGSKTFKREKGPRSQDKSIDGTLRLEENKPIDLPTDRASRRIEEPIGKFKKVPDEFYKVQGGKLYGYDVEIVQENIYGDKYQLYMTDPRIVRAENYKGMGAIGLSAANNFTEAREEASQIMRRFISRGRIKETIPPYQQMYILADQKDLPTDRSRASTDTMVSLAVDFPTDRRQDNKTSDIPTDRLMSSSGILPENILFPGEVEKQLLNLYAKNDGNITAKQFKALFKKLAPRSSKKHSFPSYESLMADVQDSVDKGMDYQWYKKWAIKMPNIVGDVNMNEFSKVFGITSAQAKPEQNLKSTLGIMALAREVKNNNDISDFNKSNISKLKTALRGKQSEYFLSKDKINMLATLYETGQMVKTGTGMKTALYANQILSDSNNQFSPWSVVDRHMLTKLGFNTNSPTETEYRMAQAMLSLLSTETYNRNGREFQFPDPSATQAILWAHERYGKVTATNEGSVDSAIKFSSKEIENISKMKQEGLFDMDHPISGMFIHNPRFQSNRTNNPFDSNLSNQMFDSIVRAAPSVAFEFKMGVDRGYLPEGFNVPFEEHLNYMENLLKDVTSGNQLRVLRTLGIPHEISISAGTYENNLTPNIVLKLPGADKNTVEGVAGLITDAFLQDSAVISRPTSDGVQTGLLLRKPNNEKFEQAELDQLMQRFSELSRDNQEVNFTVLPSEQNAVMLIDPRSFGNENYDTSDIDQFVGIIREATNNTNYALETYGQESELIQYKKAPYTKGTSRSLRLLGDKAGILGSSDLQRAVISDLYIPAFENYRRFARRNGIEPVNDLPIYSRRSALYGQLNDKGILGGISTEEWQARANRKAEQASRNHIPRINTKADPLALAVAFQMAEGKSIDNIFDEVNRDIPTDKRTSAKIPSGYEQAHEDIGGTNHLDKDFGSSIIDWADTKQTVSQTLQGLRVAIIDKLTAVERGLIEAGEKSTEAKILLNTIDTNAMADLRFSERARGVFAAMIKYGVPVLREGGTYVENFEAGGLLEIFAPLYENTKIDLEALFKIYAIGKRGTRLDAEGIPTPVTPEVIEQMKNIEAQYPEVVQVYDNYQKWNNELINYAVSQGILSETKSINELISLITSESGNYTRAMLLNLSREDLVTLAETLQIDTRGTAQIWRDNSDYYPFYRKMQDDSIRGPKIAGGFVAGNPLGIQITGSESAIEPSPLEAIARNSLSIVTAAMKNSGLAKMMDTFEASQMAERVDPRDAKGSDIIPVFVDGEKIFYRVDDPQIVAGLQSLGMNDMSGILKFLAMPASFLRDMVTRDPGFMLVNMMRDTMSAFVTSGADFKPFIDTFKNFNADFSELERWGVLGGYDFSNDEMDIVKFIQKEMRKQGIGSDGSMNATEQFVKLWDFLGEQTGKSDGATRKGVYDVIYQQTGSQREAAFQALEVINFSRRGADPLFRVITAAIPFLNARLQGLDLIYRGSRGEYSAVRSQLEGTSAEIAKQIQMKMLMRGGMLMFLTAMYYALVSDDEEYKKLSLEERDDNWIITLGQGLAFKLPIPFEIGTIFKVIPERIMDVMMGGEVADLAKSYQRQLTNTLKIDPLGFQAIKPIVEVVNNRSTYTGSEIVPYYMREGLEPSAQSRYSTNELARLIGEQLNISPLKLEYIMQGYGGTLGGYLLSMIDATLRQATDRDFLSPRIDQVPVLKRLFTSTEFGRGLEQQFYELRKESNRYVQTLNSFKKQGRTEEAKAYMANRKGIAKTRQQVLAINRWLQSWRNRRDRILNSDMSPRVKKELIEQLQLQKAKRLAYIPQLREMADLPVRFFE